MKTSARATVETFFAAYPSRDWPAKHIVVHAGDEPKGVYYIQQGGVRQYTIDQRGEEITVNTFHPGSFIPLFWVFKSEPCKYFLETSGDTVLRCAPKEDVIAFLQQNPDVVYDLLGRMYSGLDGVLMRMVYLMSGTAHTRLLHELLILSRRLAPGVTSDVRLPIKEYQLGSYCGLSKETVSREFKKFKQKHIATIERGHIIIPDVQRLEAELERLS